jgi:hypothetical protein
MGSFLIHYLRLSAAAEQSELVTYWNTKLTWKEANTYYQSCHGVYFQFL